jgi:hypothetical protein
LAVPIACTFLPLLRFRISNWPLPESTICHSSLVAVPP